MKTFISYLNENKIESVMKIDKSNSKIWVIPNTEDDKLSYQGLGVLHREDGPAMKWQDGSDNSESWYINGLLHRGDGPAYKSSSGTKQWWTNGKLNRKDGPAVEHNNGDKFWYIDGGLHRENGPAIEYGNGDIDWYLNGEEITPSIKMTSEYIRSNPKNIFKDYKWSKEMQALAIELGGERIRDRLIRKRIIDPSLMVKGLDKLDKRGFFS